MCTVRAKNIADRGLRIAKVRARRAFTLLEITLAVAIMATMALAIYRFVQSNLTSIRISSDALAADARYDGLRDILTAQWQSLPSGKGALLGDPFKLNDLPRDEIHWICSAGPGLLTRYAVGDYVVSLQLKEHANESEKFDLGFLRQPKDDSGVANENVSWVPLIDNVRSMQIRYFDAQLNVWVERWSDAGRLPRLVKLTVARSDVATPWEVIIPLGRTPL
jgi:prepilin-type N-terminal cleavage/methylation domain-containing protein